MSAIEVVVEYEETHVGKNEPLRVLAPDGASVRILDVRPIGGDSLRYQYVVVWENGGPDGD